MNVLVGYATAHESTTGIAQAVTDRLKGAGLQTDLRPIDEVDSIDSYDAVILGSAVHNRAWLPEAAAFVRSRTADLLVRPVWLFSVSSVGATSSFFGPRVSRVLRSDPKTIAEFQHTVRPRGHRSFAGAVERTHWNLAGHLFLKTFGGSYGDHRDWPDIDTWADSIAVQLLAENETAAG